MARNTQSSNDWIEIQNLYRIWSQVDSRIALPPGLRGSALLAKLEESPRLTAVDLRKPRFSPRLFTWQSGITYVAAFVLIIALSAVLSRGEQEPADIIQGPISMYASSETQEEAAVTADANAAVPAAEQEAGILAADAQADQAPGAEATPPESAQPEAQAKTPAEAQEPGIGGQSNSVALGSDELYTYTWRENDPSDPDKMGTPVTINILDTETGELAATMDVAEMRSVVEYLVFGDTLVLVGQTGADTVLATYDLSDVAQPVELAQIISPGAYQEVNLYNGAIHMLTLTDTSANLDCEVVQLPGGVSDAACVVTAVDLTTGDEQTKAFSGANGEVALFDLHAYIHYTGEITDENSTGSYMAQIRLNGANID